MNTVRADGRYEVSIRRGRFGNGASYEWSVVSPDGHVASGTTFAPAWLWVARWSARRAARQLMLSAATNVAAHYFLRPNFVRESK